jgi:hypothetical protein
VRAIALGRRFDRGFGRLAVGAREGFRGADRVGAVSAVGSSSGSLVSGAGLHPVERWFVSVIGRIQLRILSFRRGGT